MDRINEYRQIIQNVLEAHARIPYSHGQIKSSVIVDGLQNNFLLIDVGWDGAKRIHGCIVHVEIIDGKIWIQRDGIESGITRELVAAGIPTDNIVLGFHPPHVRQYTGYALA